MKDDVTHQAGKSLLALLGAFGSAMTLNQWVALCTIGYIVLQAAYLARKWWREEKESKP